MRKTMLRSFVTLLVFSARLASAGNLPEAIAFDASNEAAAQIFSSPALPSLDNDGMSLTPVYGIVTMEGVDEMSSFANGEEFPITNRGEIKGEVAGLTFNRSGSGDLGFFATAAWSRVGGDMNSQYLGITNDIRDISAQTYIGVIGLNYRIVGTATSFFAFGFFGGPAIIKAKTSARFFHGDGTSTRVSLDPESQAAYIGFQAMFRPGKFRINPYLNILANTSLGCFKPAYEGDPYPTSQYSLCANGDRGITAMAAMSGLGINVGYGRFQFGLWHKAEGGNLAFKSNPLVFSLRIGL